MNNYMKTIISGLKQWVSSQKSDWNQNDSSAANFIKNRPFYSEEKEKVLFSGNIPAENAWDDVYGAEGLAYGLSFTTGQIYKITFDNVEYLCECKLLNSEKVFGNTMIVGEGEETEEPFFIGYSDNWGLCVFCLTEGTHSLSISGTVEEVHQIDSKYVPIPELADVAHTGDYYDLQNTPYIPWDTVQYATSQSLPDSNKKIARNNIGASGATNLLNGSRVFSLRGSNTSETIGSGSVAFGSNTEASGNYSQAMGAYSVSKGDYSHAEGYRTTAFGQSSHAEGSDTMASGDYSHAEGYGNVTSITLTGDASVVEYTTSTTNASSYKGCKFIYNGQLFTVINTSGSIVTLDKTLSGTENINNLQLKVYKSYASGKYSHVEGYDTTASGDWAHAEGIHTIANYQGSHAQGNGTIASAPGAHAEGVDTVAEASASHAEGWGTIARGQDSHVQGKFNIVNRFKYAHIVGNGTSDTARSNAHTLDWNGVGWFKGGLKVGGTSQDDPNAKEVALKSDVEAVKNDLLNGAGEAYDTLKELGDLIDNSTDAIAALETVAANKVDKKDGITGLSVSGKTITYTKGNGSTGIITTQDTTYSNATTSTAGLMSAADKTKVDNIATNLVNGTGTKSLKGAGANYASGENAVALGSAAAALGADAIALGPAATALGDCSYAEGKYTLAFGDYSHAEGRRTLAQGNYSHAEGWGQGNICRFTSEANAAEITLTSGDITNISIGDKFYYNENIYEIIGKTTSTITLDRPVSSSAISNGRTANIYKGYASGICSHAEGCQTKALGIGSHAEGYYTTASGDKSHAEGELTTASNYYSHAEGYNTTASGQCSHAEGRDTTASHGYTHAEGYNTIASGIYSHAEGSYTKAASEYQHVQGKYNIEDSAKKYAHIVGNGESDTARSNAHTLDWDGVGWYKGDLKVGGTGQDDETAKSVLLTPTEEETLEMLTEMELVDPVGEEGFIYTDENGVMYTLI